MHSAYCIIFVKSCNKIGIAIYFVYSSWYLKKYETCIMLDTHTETTVY